MANATGARKVTVIHWADDIPDDVDFGETINCGGSYKSDHVRWGIGGDAKKMTVRRYTTTPDPAPTKPVEPTEAQIRARHREAVTRATATVQKALEKLDVLSRPGMVEELFVLGAYDNSEATSFKNPLTNYLKAVVEATWDNTQPLPLPKIHTAHPHVIINSTDIGTASMYLQMPPAVADFCRTLTTRGW